MNKSLRVGAAFLISKVGNEGKTNLRERFQEVPLLLEIPSEVRQLSNVVLKLDNLFPLLALEALDNIRHLALQRILDLDGYVVGLGMEVMVLVDPNKELDEELS